MRTHIIAFLAGLITSALLFPVVAAQQTPAKHVDGVEGQFMQLNQTMRDLVKVIRENQADQKLDIYMKRIDLSRRNLQPHEDDLRRLQQERKSAQNSHEEMLMQVSRMEEELRQAESGIDSQKRAEWEKQKKQLNAYLDLLEVRIRAFDQSILDLENQIFDRQRQIDDWQDSIDEQLGLKG